MRLSSIMGGWSKGRAGIVSSLKVKEKNRESEKNKNILKHATWFPRAQTFLGRRVTEVDVTWQ